MDDERSEPGPDRDPDGDGEATRSQARFDLIDEIGGPQGIADSSIPAIVFVAVYSLAGNRIGLSGLAAVGVAALIAVLRLLRGESLRFALTGLIGVAVAAFIADRTGKAEDFFLPGLLLNAGYAAAYLISILVRWPLLGVILGPVLGEGMSWRSDPQKMRVYTRASWVWVGVFSARLAVQLPFYLSGSLVALGIARTAMGLPVFALGVWLSYLILKRAGIVTSFRGTASRFGAS